ncbi:prokaryotic RING finger family 4 domain-containing protein [Ditylenchus destructor]|uniref:E3 ubiquitin-protein ligase CBL n=1 Tax=Ditylenchus destructor TaxID=166010 RepID=A0AAD4ND28_9BILA|nr:prokaryotic RING finger family 4 domain-containing protein [Ditylenchus destructor]
MEMSGFASSLLNRIQDLVGTNPSTHQASAISSLGNRLPIGNSTTTLATLVAPGNVLNQQDRRSIEKLYRSIEGVLRFCRQPSLNLKKSPPCILDILPEMYTSLESIFLADGEILQTNMFLQLFISNLTAKCKQTIRIFKEEKTKVLEEGSKARRSLTMKALTFSHMLSELQSQFRTGGRFIGEEFRITKKEAAEFWSASFANRTVVSWEEFRNELSKVHPIGVGIETHALKSTIDLTCNDYISNFEFDVFTRLFHPWSSLLKNWQILAVTHPAYMAFMTYEEVKQKLQQFINKPGSYVFRLSCTKLGQWAIGYVAPDRKIYQTIPQSKSLIQSLVDGNREGFYLYPNGRNKNVDLSFALQSHPEGRLKVTSEQYQIYCEMGSTFEMCKICDERNKNVRLEPCGHLLCRPCLNNWQESVEGGSTCPFCRCEIKGTESIVIEGYSNRRTKKLNNNLSTEGLQSSSPVLDSKRSSMSSENLMTFSPLPENNKGPESSHTSNTNCDNAPRFPSPSPPIPPKRNILPPMSAPVVNNADKENNAVGDSIRVACQSNVRAENSSGNCNGTANALETQENQRQLIGTRSSALLTDPAFDPFETVENPWQTNEERSTSPVQSTSTNQLPQFQDFMSMEFMK